MAKTIYLPERAKEQLETSDDSSVWAKPIPFEPNPTPGYTWKLTLGFEEKNGYDVVENGWFYPDRTEPDSVLERLIKVSGKAPKQKPIVYQPEFAGAKYRCFEGNDAECWARMHNGKIDVLNQFQFYFVGLLTGPSSYHLNQERTLDRVLAEGAGVYINRKVLPLCDGSYDGNSYSPKSPKFRFTDEDKVSLDGNTYKIFQDYDQGARGWALFLRKKGKKIENLFEDHNDNVRDWMHNDGFIKNLKIKIDLKYLYRYNHDFYKKRYEPTDADFKSDVHIDDKGRRKKA